jgi:O-antigen ligase
MNNYYYGPNRPMRAFYRYAHNDILQFVAEYGLVGVGLLAAALGSLLVALLRQLARLPLATLFLCVGLALACGHAFIDFIFNSPTYWVALSGGLAVICRLGTLGGEGDRGR